MNKRPDLKDHIDKIEHQHPDGGDAAVDVAEIPIQPKLTGIQEPPQLLQRKPATQKKSHQLLSSPFPVESIETRTVGRAIQFKRLKDVFHKTIETNEQHIVLLAGEAGIGKSRLLSEFDRWLGLLPQDMHVLIGFGHPSTTNQPYSMIRDLFSNRFRIKGSDSSSEMREKLERGVRSVVSGKTDWQSAFQHIGELLGFEIGENPGSQTETRSTKSFYNQALVYLEEYFNNLSLKAPLVILLEDLHWTDDSSLKLIAHINTHLAQYPILIVATARPSFFSHYPDWLKDLNNMTRIDLHQLTLRDSQQLISEILQKVQDLPLQIGDLILSRAQGNPFYIEEWIKHLVQTGVIIKSDPDWKVDPSRLSAGSIPSTLVGLLQARIDHLPDLERHSLQFASVIGRIFWEDAVAYLNSEDPKSASLYFAESLNKLNQREMLSQNNNSTFDNTPEYHFKHSLMRAVAYGNLLKSERRMYHSRTAGWLKSTIQETGRTGEYTSLIAEHHDLAKEHDLAADWYRLAGERAFAKYSNPEAVRSFTRALELTPDDDHSAKYALLSLREKANDCLGDRYSQKQDLEAMTILANQLDTDHGNTARHRISVALRLAHYYEDANHYKESSRYSQLAVKLANSTEDIDAEAQARVQWGISLQLSGELHKAQLQFEEALHLADHIDAQDIRSECFHNLGIIHEHKADFQLAQYYYQQFMDFAIEHNDRSSVARALRHLGVNAYQTGDYHDAAKHLKYALNKYKHMGDRFGENNTLVDLSKVCLVNGDYAASRQYSQQVLKLSQTIRDFESTGSAFSRLAAISFCLSDYTAALEYSRRSSQIFTEIGNQIGESRTFYRQALSWYYTNDLRRSHAAALEALSTAAAIDAREEQGFAQDVLGRALLKLGDRQAGKDALHAAVRLRTANELRMLSLANLAEVYHFDDDLETALVYIESILQHLERTHIAIGTPLDTTCEPFRIYLICHQVLKKAGDPRAAIILKATYTQMQKRAEQIEIPSERHSFLHKNFVHVKLLQAWQAEYGQSGQF